MERQPRKEATHTGRCKTSWQDLATERIRPVWLKMFERDKKKKVYPRLPDYWAKRIHIDLLFI